jgi:hypothetical protein
VEVGAEWLRNTPTSGEAHRPQCLAYEIKEAALLRMPSIPSSYVSHNGCGETEDARKSRSATWVDPYFRVVGSTISCTSYVNLAATQVGGGELEYVYHHLSSGRRIVIRVLSKRRNVLVNTEAIVCHVQAHANSIFPDKLAMQAPLAVCLFVSMKPCASRSSVIAGPSTKTELQ